MFIFFRKKRTKKIGTNQPQPVLISPARVRSIPTRNLRYLGRFSPLSETTRSTNYFGMNFACHALEMGMDIVTLQHLLGHAHLSTTLIYLKVAEAPKSNWFSPLDLWAH